MFGNGRNDKLSKGGHQMLNKLKNRVYYMPHYSETDRPTLGFVSGDKYSLIIDAGNSPAHATEFLNEIKQLKKSQVQFLLITHWHWDHVFGIKTMDLPTISHRETKSMLDHMKTLKWDDISLDERVKTGEEIEFCRDMMKREMPTRDHLTVESANIIFDDRVEFDLGGVTVLMEHVGGEHSTDSSIVYVVEEKVLFLGDCISADYYSGENSYDLSDLTTLSNKLKKYNAEYYVHGHLPPLNYEEFWGFMNNLFDIGEFVGNETHIDNILEKYSDLYQTAPKEEDLENIQYFVNGNKKR